MFSREVCRQERQPQQHGCIDAEHDELGLVEVGRQHARFEGVKGAHRHQNQVEGDADHEADLRHGAFPVHHFLVQSMHDRLGHRMVNRYGDAR